MALDDEAFNRLLDELKGSAVQFRRRSSPRPSATTALPDSRHTEAVQPLGAVIDAVTDVDPVFVTGYPFLGAAPPARGRRRGTERLKT
jgi:hypothetical protein